MATILPAKLKAAAPDVQRFATRAAQLEKFRPIVSYWCEYYLLQQILSRQLHSTDEECTQYALQLMDKLESYKSENATNDAVTDDLAAKAYIENFALETFARGDEAQRTNKVTKQTADTFQASATFMDLLSIWGQLEPEIQAKIKYAKFHALRIAKAIKAGEDPNASNPVIESPPEPNAAEDDGLEAELKNLENGTGIYMPPTVESAPESAMPSRPQSTLHHEPFQPPAVGTSRPVSPPALQQGEPDVSPIESTDHANSRAGSIGGGYFPAIPGAPGNIDDAVSSPGQAQDAPSTFAPADPATFYSTAPPPSIPGPGDFGIAPSELVTNATPQQAGLSSQPVPPPHPASPAVRQQPAIPPKQPSIVLNSHAPPRGGYNTDDDAIMAAQKHAKWAISALNFEDVNTAVKELKMALQSLGSE